MLSRKCKRHVVDVNVPSNMKANVIRSNIKEKKIDINSQSKKQKIFDSK